MLKKYTIIVLGALVLSGQASGMGSWGRKLWAPAAVSASVFTAKATLCQGENGNPNGYIDRFKAWVGWTSDQMPEHVRQALDKKALNKGASEPELSVFTPQDLSDVCKACNVSILGSDENDWVSARYYGMRHINCLARKARRNSHLDGTKVDHSEVNYYILKQTPYFLFNFLSDSYVRGKLEYFASMQDMDLKFIVDYEQLRDEILEKELVARDGAKIKEELQQQAGYWKCFREKVMAQGNKSDAYDAQRDCSGANGNYYGHDAALASRSFDAILERAEKSRQKAAEELSKARIARSELSKTLIARSELRRAKYAIARKEAAEKREKIH